MNQPAARPASVEPLSAGVALRALTAAEVARSILEGFDKHYRLFRAAAVQARHCFEQADWPAMRELARSRIQMYDQRVAEAVASLLAAYPQTEHDESLWPAIKLSYIPLLHEHRQPELAETFFNSVACQVLHRRYYRNEFIFWRPAVATEHLEGEKPAYRSYYPRKGGAGLRATLESIVRDIGLANPFEDLHRDLRNVVHALRAHFARPTARAAEPADPGARVTILPQQGGLHRRQGDERPRGAAVRGADPAERTQGAVSRYAAARAAPAAGPVFVCARLFLCRHGGAGGVRLVPEAADAEEAARRDVHGGGTAQAGQDRVLPRPALPPDALVGQFRHRARDQGHGDAGLHAALVPVRVQGDPRPLRAAQGNGPRDGEAQVPAGEVPRPGRPPRGHARILAGRAAAGAVRCRASRGAQVRGGIEHRDRRRPRGHQARLHRAAHAAAQPVPRGSGTRRRCGSATPRAARVRQRDQGARRRQHLPGRHAAEELRRDAPQPRRVLRLRRDRVHDRLQFPAHSAAAQPRRGNVGRTLLFNRAA